jgi:hypothetical protein
MPRIVMTVLKAVDLFVVHPAAHQQSIEAHEAHEALATHQCLLRVRNLKVLLRLPITLC